MVLIGGIVVLMIGIYRISRHIPSNSNKEENTKSNEE
jgi:hypothetical protein